MMCPTHTATLEVRAPVPEQYANLLSPPALEFIEALVREFRPQARELLERRAVRQREFDAGRFPDFPPETASLRQAEWRVAPIPADLQDRRVEITGPTDRKMIINALNSGASVYMADFEDANSPTWHNLVDGQQNLCDTVNGTIRFVAPEGKEYRLKERTATLMVRPRGLHLPEKHVWIDDGPVPGFLFDFGLFFFHNGATSGQRLGALFLSAQAGEPPGGAAVE